MIEPTPINYDSPSPYPSTVLTGTSPYMLGRGPPAEDVGVEDTLRPQDTLHDKNILINGYQRGDRFLKYSAPATFRYPRSSRADLQNYMYSERHPKK